ncbi:MAG: glycosyltransferase, partial [Pseudomonadota bacterium]
MTRVACVIIGRNEGERLVACLASVPQGLGDVVYVDSGSTDGSVEAAEAAGARVVLLDTGAPFTAARARNAGAAALDGGHDYVQFIDGDCVLDPGWVPTAQGFLDAHPEVAVACGRRRERFPERSAYNRLCDFEWDTPVGQARACGGDAMMRLSAFEAVGGFNPSLIAGEEPELCVRLRAAGWQVWRLEAEMTLHDAAITRFGQFWKRAQRSGHAFAEGAAMHGRPPERHGVVQMRRALLWGAGLPVLIVLIAVAFGPWALLLSLVYLVQVARL